MALALLILALVTSSLPNLVVAFTATTWLLTTGQFYSPTEFYNGLDVESCMEKCLVDPDCIGFYRRSSTEYCSLATTGATLYNTDHSTMLYHKGDWDGGPGPNRPGLAIVDGPSISVNYDNRDDVVQVVGDMNPIAACTPKNYILSADMHAQSAAASRLYSSSATKDYTWFAPDDMVNASFVADHKCVFRLNFVQLKNVLASELANRYVIGFPYNLDLYIAERLLQRSKAFQHRLLCRQHQLEGLEDSELFSRAPIRSHQARHFDYTWKSSSGQIHQGDSNSILGPGSWVQLLHDQKQVL